MEKYILTDHALMQMQRRDIAAKHVKSVMTSPEQKEVVTVYRTSKIEKYWRDYRWTKKTS